MPTLTLNALAVRRDGRIVVGGAIVAGGLAACRGHDDSALARYRGG